ncbi:Bug family tripartite tricarboxylate transporter substrate binding protein [Paralcaligenes ureilyticus]|uniref:Tripartite-type tricarboxylate transporter receptor subunit TctC n=1 Tax=Paralcaligenes ureilyticus TaxID=627131 RepID=A0A4V2UXG0_9BURK|nr:tripartite tricarboxylate transporter substrate binding protein [Paralcaligenes ureilyticus]TCT03408.1 tripartite-type tricarboxylate transporter receptor subunit TctC [Paralcaligenes ureilyticus]
MKLLAKLVYGLTIALISSTAATAATTRNYPDHAIKLIVPFPPGGGTDLIARDLAKTLAQQSGWTIIVENRAGAGGDIGIAAAAKASPDGYTWVLGQTSNLAINPTLHSNLPYDPFKSFIPISLVADSALVMVAPGNAKYSTVPEFVKAVNEGAPDSMNFGLPGIGTVAQLTTVLFEHTAQIKITNVPYKGASDGLPALMGNQIQAYMSSIPTLLGSIKAGQIKALGVTSKSRASVLPDVPTIDESGYKGFNATTWFGILVPANTPKDITVTLNAAINKAVKNPDFIKRMSMQGATTLGGTSEDFTNRLRTDYDMWADVIKKAHITLAH